jgi:hypothetical protein
LNKSLGGHIFSFYQYFFCFSFALEKSKNVYRYEYIPE